jgi:DNA-binding transcriptional MerR regulator
MSDPEYVAIEVAGRLTGVPARTLRRWAEAGKVPVVAGQRKRLVRLDDVRRLAAMTGHQSDTDDLTGAYAGQATGHMTGGVAGDNMPSPGAVSPAARSQLEAIRDEWLQPLIDQLREAERTIGRLEAERDALRSELTAAQTMPQERAASPRSDENPTVVSDSLISRLRRLIGR